MHPKAGLLALVLALTLTLWSSVRCLRQSRTAPANDIPSQLARFQSIIRAIPANDVIGYFSDVKYQTPLPTPPYSVKYAFAPRMLVWFPDQASAEWVVGDFNKTQDYRAAGRRLGLRFVQDFGNGVVLYHRGTG